MTFGARSVAPVPASTSGAMSPGLYSVFTVETGCPTSESISA